MRAVKRKLRKLWKRGGRTVVILVGAVGVIGLTVYADHLSKMNSSINPAAYKPLLDLIARVESSDNYNAYFGNAKNTKINFTSMTVDEVLQWQKEYVKKGSPSSAVGRYQIIDTTLSGLVERLDINTKQKFDKPMQDRLAVALLERRGAASYVKEKITREEFAANLAKEWAALPKVTGNNPNESYYAGDGLNKSRVDVKEVLTTIEKVDVQ